MNGFIHPSTQVAVTIPGSPQPPTIATLSDLLLARRASQLPDTATVQLGPNEPWLPIDDVLAKAGLFLGPAPTRWLVVALAVAPGLWAVLHALLFQIWAPFLFLLAVIGVVVAVVASSNAALRTKSSKELVVALRGRPMLWRGTLATLVVCELATLGSAGMRVWHHRRAEKVFTEKDDCAFADKYLALDAADDETLNDAQKTEGRQRLGSCDVNREKEAAGAYAEKCKSIAGSVASGKLSPEDRAHVESAIPGGNDAYMQGLEGIQFAERIASRSLGPKDLASMRRLPCGPAMNSAYVRAAARSAGAWAALARGDEVGNDVLEALGAQPIDKTAPPKQRESLLSDEVKSTLHKRAEEVATTMREQTLAEAERASGLCVLERRLGGKNGPSCTALALKVVRLRAAEVVAQKNNDARCKAAATARQQCVRGCDAKQPHDELGMPADDFDQSLDCYERCEKTYPASGCE